MALSVDLTLLRTLIAQAGHGLGEAEYRFHPARRWRFDVGWVGPRVAFEREGGTWSDGRHTRGAGYRNDCEKYNAAQLAGWVVIRGTVDMIRSGQAAADLLAALAGRAATVEDRA